MKNRALFPLMRLVLLLLVSVALPLVQSLAILAVASGLLILLAVITGLPKGLGKLAAMAVLLSFPWLFLMFCFAGREATGSWLAAFRWGFEHLIPYALRIGNLVLVNLLFIRTTSLAEMVEALKALRLPDTAVLYLSTILRFLPQTLQEARRVIEAQRCRGLVKRRLLTPSGLLAVFVPLFISQIQRSRELAISLEIRSSTFRSGGKDRPVVDT
jgi:energy-coupling factor transporter transmembrane protein EcfT